MVRLPSKPRSSRSPTVQAHPRQKRENPPNGMVLSATGGGCFFWSGMGIVLVPRKRHDADGYYRLIGVPVDADEETLKTAAKKALMEAHPDHGGTEEGFMMAYSAYKTLTDPLRRAEYDTRPPKASLTVETIGGSPKAEIEPYAQPRCARTAYYKEPDIMMSDEDEREVDAWAQHVMEAAQVRGIKMKVKVGVRKSVDHQYAEEPENVYVIQQGQKAKKYMAHILMALTNKTKETQNEFID